MSQVHGELIQVRGCTTCGARNVNGKHARLNGRGQCLGPIGAIRVPVVDGNEVYLGAKESAIFNYLLNYPNSAPREIAKALEIEPVAVTTGLAGLRNKIGDLLVDNGNVGRNSRHSIRTNLSR